MLLTLDRVVCPADASESANSCLYEQYHKPHDTDY